MQRHMLDNSMSNVSRNTRGVQHYKIDCIKSGLSQDNSLHTLRKILVCSIVAQILCDLNFF